MPTKLTKQIVDHEVLEKVRRAAEARAKLQAQDLPSVAWLLLRAAAKVAKPSEDAVAHPAQRPREETKGRVRFRADPDEYAWVKQAIRDSGRSVSSVLEDQLARYARTGNID